MSEDRWLVVQLSNQGEGLEDTDELILAIQKIDPRIEVYLPAFSWSEKSVTEKVVFLPGYIFVRYDLPVVCLEKILECPFVMQILKEGERYSLVKQKDFDDLKERFKIGKMEEFKEGHQIRVAKGFWRGYEGEIVSMKDFRAVILVTRTSMERLLDVPIYFVEEM